MTTLVASKLKHMASQSQVKTYLAYWFQLGRKVILPRTSTELLPQPVIQGGRYSPEFENCWQTMICNQGKDCYLEGTNQTVAELLSPAWEIWPCARCEMPVPILDSGVQPLECPCSDLLSWPNSELPQPRSPVSNSIQICKIQSRLVAKKRVGDI